MKRTLILLGLALCLLAGALTSFSSAAFTRQKSNPGNTFTAAADFCVGAGTQSITADRDAYVDANSQSTNFGSTATLFVKTKTLLSILDTRDRTLVGFTLPSIPSNCDLTAATLKLNASSATGGRTLVAQRATSSWTEGGVTWNNQPSVTNTNEASTSSGSGTVQWTVTAMVLSMYSGTNNGFLVVDSNENALLSLGSPQQFDSRTQSPSSVRPTLQLTFS
ncbi:MAG: large repetitive protein [Thermoleophilaceae bacterium]|jgi:hypothetical protein|nr:large repetitive protein [Thermoleophilaceae bacterium]